MMLATEFGRAGVIVGCVILLYAGAMFIYIRDKF